MLVAVNTRFLLKDALEGYGFFIQELFSRIVREHPEHQFYFLFDRPYDAAFVLAPNVTPIVIGPPARHPVLWKWWYDVQVPGVLKKIRADVFVSPDGFCSLTTRVPQCLIVHDLGFLHYPDGYQKSHLLFYKYFTPKFLKKARVVATVSEFSRQDILKTYHLSPKKIAIVSNGVKSIFQPLPFEQQQAVRDKYSASQAYFIYVGAIHPRKNLLNLLKAFSLFKKRQRSSMKLLLVGRLAWRNDAFLTLLKTYKYRDDVLLLHYVEDDVLAQLIASAYGMVYPSLFEGFGVPVAEAMRCGVPVLTSKDSAMQEVTAAAALYFDPTHVTDMAEALMRIYTNERLRTQLIAQGLHISKQYTWEAAAAALWACIEKAAKQ